MLALYYLFLVKKRNKRLFSISHHFSFILLMDSNSIILILWSRDCLIITFPNNSYINCCWWLCGIKPISSPFLFYWPLNSSVLHCQIASIFHSIQRNDKNFANFPKHLMYLFYFFKKTSKIPQEF